MAALISIRQFAGLIPERASISAFCSRDVIDGRSFVRITQRSTTVTRCFSMSLSEIARFELITDAFCVQMAEISISFAESLECLEVSARAFYIFKPLGQRRWRLDAR